MKAKELGKLSAYPDMHLDWELGAGFSRREQIAAMALQGMLSSDMSTDRTKANFQKWAVGAVAFADALLAELAKDQP